MTVDALRGAADRLRFVYLDRPLLRVVRRRLQPEDGHDVLVLRNVCTVLVQLRGKSSRLSEISNDNPGEVAMHRATAFAVPSRVPAPPRPGYARGAQSRHVRHT